MFADLHLHSFFSDGTYSPEEVAGHGKRCNFTALSLTDHDTVEGCERMGAACATHGIEFIAGTELTAEHGGNELHLLGYFLDTQNETLLREISLQVAAANPQYVKREDVPADILEREKSVYRAQMENSGKPPAVIEKIIEGKLGSFYELVCLVDQPSIRDPKTTINAMLQAAIAKLGENISVARFVRFKVGEVA